MLNLCISIENYNLTSEIFEIRSDIIEVISQKIMNILLLLTKKKFLQKKKFKLFHHLFEFSLKFK